MGVGIVVVVILEVARPFVLLVVVMTFLLVLPAKFVIKRGILSFTASIG